MPILEYTKHSPPAYYPESDYEIVKYMDLTKFISLLFRKSLFFCRLDMLEDQFEGTTAKPNFELRRRWYLETNMTDKDLTEQELADLLKTNYDHEKKMKSLNCVNCWNKKDHESAALWKIYSDFSKGIMVTSSISKLTKALQKSPEEMNISEIRYLDYNKQAMPDGNTTYPIIHKQIAYSYENEVRLIHEKMPPSGWDWDWSKEEIKEGVYIDVNVNDLIKEIVVSPYSPKWFFYLIQDICHRYSLNKPILKSDLSTLE